MMKRRRRGNTQPENGAKRGLYERRRTLYTRVHRAETQLGNSNLN